MPDWFRIAEVAAGDLAGAALTVYLADKVTPSFVPYRTPALAVLGAVAAAGTNWVQEDWKPTSSRAQFAVDSPITFSILTFAYGSLYEVLFNLGELLLFPELEMFGVGTAERVVTLASFGLGAVSAYQAGPTVGEAGQLAVWALLKILGYNPPKPEVVKDAPSFTFDHIVDLGWRLLRDFTEKVGWYDTLKPMIVEFKNASKTDDNLLKLGYVLLGLWDMLMILPHAVSAGEDVVMTKLIEAMAIVVKASL